MLDLAPALPFHEEIVRQGMPQRVRRKVVSQPNLARPTLDYKPKTLAAEFLASLVQEHRTLFVIPR